MSRKAAHRSASVLLGFFLGTHCALFACRSYAINSWYVYRATAPAGYQITNIILTYGYVESGYDYCMLRNANVTTWATTGSVLYSYSGTAGAMSAGPYAGNYGGVAQFELYSDSSVTYYGCRWTFDVTAW